jgi:hypothetical protein
MVEDFSFVPGREGTRTFLREFIALKREFAVSRIIDFDTGED